MERKFKIGDKIKCLNYKEILTIAAYTEYSNKYLAKGKIDGHFGMSCKTYNEDGSIYTPTGESDYWWVNDECSILIEEENMEKGVVKLSLEDAKKLYEQGGNFRTIALGAYSEEELEYTPKDGDFVFVQCSFNKNSFVFIKKPGKDKTTRYISYEYKESSLHYLIGKRITDDNDIAFIRPATEVEKNLLLETMHDEGKDWDPINKKIIPYKWKARYGEIYYYLCNNFSSGKFEVMSTEERGTLEDGSFFKSHNYFKTKEKAQKVADKINNIFKEL